MSGRHARRLVLSFTLMLTAAGAARAQTPAPGSTPAPAPFDHGYAEALAESAFGNVTSQSFGGEVGVTVTPALQVFGTFGGIGDVATAELGAAASTIALALSQLQPGAVSYSVKEPVTFFSGGVRFRIPSSSILKPYISGGVGVAIVKKDVQFLINGADASSTLPQYVTLGSDIAGDETKMMITVGGGVVWQAWRQLIVDLHYQYGYISTETAISVNRAGVGLGVRF